MQFLPLLRNVRITRHCYTYIILISIYCAIAKALLKGLHFRIFSLISIALLALLLFQHSHRLLLCERILELHSACSVCPVFRIRSLNP